MNSIDSLRQHYDQRAAECRQVEQRLRETSRRLSHVRVALFFPALTAGLCGAFLDGFALIGYSACALLTAVFVAVVMRHDRISHDQQVAGQRARLNEELSARLDRRWDKLREPPEVSVPLEIRATASDLDLFGRASVFQLVCQANTPLGKRTLARWLIEPDHPDDIRARQQSVRELIDQVEWREELNVEGRLLARGLTNPDRFLGWVKGPRWLARRTGLMWASRAAPLVFVLGTVAAIWQWAPRDAAGGLALAAVIANVIISVVFTGRIHDIFYTVTSPSGEMQRYGALFGLLASGPHETPRLDALRRVAVEDDRGAERALRGLQWVMGLANLRRAGLFGAVYLLLQIFFLWDFHILWLLERWQLAHREKARKWFEALGEVEALSSFASLARDEPTWTFPEFDEAADTLCLEGAGHPLLSAAQRVLNDVELGPPGSFLLVTGSNMSGKSTLLRSIGVNAFLAQAGGPVCAARFRLPPLEIATSMRIQDSLADGVSFFLAELRRLKEIVDQADRYREGSGRVMLFLLDEILQGTNSRERRIAVCRVISHLVGRRTFGAVSTHDLELAADPALANACRAIHFRESFVQRDGRREMTFDYQLRPGVSPTTNALALLEMVGLSEGEEAGG